MPTTAVTQRMPVPKERVFRLLHDYNRRLEWDTLLQSAGLTRGCESAGTGATSLCVGKNWLGSIGIETVYVTFHEGEIAAVKMINSPPCFQSFAASIRHEDNPGGSMLTYRLTFRSKPAALRWLMEPVMLLVLKWETRKRLRALASYLGLHGSDLA